MSKVKPIPDGYHTVTPSFTFKDSKKAIEFYQKAFNAKNAKTFPAPDGKRIMHATIEIGNSIIQMGDEWPGMCSSAQTLGESPIGLYLYVEDADKFFNQAVAAGATPIMPMSDAFWGDRCGCVKDPFGYKWNIATHQKDLTEEQVNKGAEAFFDQMAKKKF